MKKNLLISAVAFLLINLTFHFGILETGKRSSYSEIANKIFDLKQRLQHYNQNSLEADNLIREINRLKREAAGEVKADQPDEFMRILSEMRVPTGEEKSSYPANYRINELKKAKERSSLKKGTSSQMQWMERGPGNVAGRARGLIVDPDDPNKNTWFVGSVGGGIWKTTDAGTNWETITPDFPNLAVSAITMAPSNHDVIYAGTGESMYSVDVINGDGMLKSTDRGMSWTQLTSTVSNYNFNNIARIVVDPANEDIVVAAVSSGRYLINVANKSGIFKSIDGGTTWNEVYTETEMGGFSRVKKVLQIIDTPGDFNILFAGIDEKGVIKSTDAGDTWFNSSTGIDDFSGRFELAISPSDTSKIYAAAEGSPNSNLFVSSDAGANWIRTTENGTEPNWLSSQGWYDNTIAVHPTNENIVFVGGVRLFQINVNGTQRTTTQLSTGPVHVDHHNLVIIPGDGLNFRILNANDGGIGVSANGASDWSKPTLGMNTSQFYGMDKMPGGSAYAGGMQDNGTWFSGIDPDAFTNWSFAIGGDGYEVSWHFNDPLKMIGGSQYNGLRRTLDGGVSFQSAQSGLGDTGGGNAPFITKIAKSNMEPDLLFAVGKSGVWKSTNFGGSWSLRAISSQWGSISSFHDVKISRANPDIVWAGSRMDGSNKIHLSTDRGETFNTTSLYPLTSLGLISGLATHPTQDSAAYVMFSFAQKPKVLRTTDLGQNWEDISGFGSNSTSSNGFPDVAVYDLLVFPHTPDTIWAGTEIGLFESTDNGVSWHMANNGLPNVSIWAMTHVEDEVVLGTHGRGIWSVEIPGMSLGQTYNPLIKNLTQGTDGALSININLRSLYDSSLVKINNTVFKKIDENVTHQLDTTLQYPVVTAENLLVQVVSFKNGTEYPSVTKNISVIPFQSAQLFYFNDFDSPTSDFIGSGFTIKSQTGFSSDAIHSPHPHSNNLNNTYTLTVPIIVAPTEAFLKYDDVAIIEPGEAGTVFGDSEFWDYVIVEGTKDGTNWIPLEDGYDARKHSDWLNAYNSSSNGTSALYKTNELNLLNTFMPGDQILIRFRLFADAAVTGWGWVIDNLHIQPIINSVDDEKIPSSFSLEQNYPNPFNPATTIKYSIPAMVGASRNLPVQLIVFDILGRETAILVNEKQSPGNYEVSWGAKGFSSGIYFYRLKADKFVETKKMILLK